MFVKVLLQLLCCRIMNTPKPSAVARLVDKLGGPPQAAQTFANPKIIAQEIHRWVARGFISPKHLDAVEPHLPTGITRAMLVAEIKANSPGIARNEQAKSLRLQRLRKQRLRVTQMAARLDRQIKTLQTKEIIK
jgi:hypothetical protein